MKTSNHINLKALALVLLGAATANAAPLLTDHFDGSTGNTLGSNGWSLIASSGGAATNVVAQDLSKSGFAASSGNAVQLRPNGQDWYSTYTTQAYDSASNASLYYSFLLRVDDLGSLDATGGFFGGMAAVGGVSGRAAMIGMRLSGTGFQLGVAKRDSTALSFDSTVFSTGTTILVVGAYNLVSGNIQNDTASLWINPGSLGAGSAPAATLSAFTTAINNDTQSFSSFVWTPQGTGGSTQIPGSLIVDELRVGNSWADVTPVPEPGTFALVVLAGGAFLARRRRRLIA